MVVLNQPKRGNGSKYLRKNVQAKVIELEQLVCKMDTLQNNVLEGLPIGATSSENP